VHRNPKEIKLILANNQQILQSIEEMKIKAQTKLQDNKVKAWNNLND
jgi:hypothetical protein